MIDLATPLKHIEELIPSPVDVDLGSVPDAAPAQELARTIGADPSTVIALHTLVTSNREELGRIVTNAMPFIAAAGRDLLAIGTDFLTRAIRILPGFLVPLPGAGAKAMAELSLLAATSLAKAQERIVQLGRELVPSIMQLDRVSTEPLPELPEPVTEPEPVALSSSTQGEAAVQAALSQLGTPYVWGGTTPGVGFDCSGFTQWAWRQAGLELPRLAQEQNVGRAVARHELQAGDLAVWDGHVAMYDGNGHLIEAGDPVSRNPLRETNMGMAFMGYFRPTG